MKRNPIGGLVEIMRRLYIGLFLFAASNAFAATYSFNVINSANIVPGVTDTGNHCDDCVTTVSLPFTWSLYGNAYSSVDVSSNGNMQFTSANTGFSNLALPAASFGDTIFPFWDDLRTDGGGTYGIFTSTSGAPGSQIFNIEWRAHYFSGGASTNFEAKLYEGQSRFDLVFGTLNYSNSVTVGVQNAAHTDFTQYVYNGTGGTITDNMTLTTGPATATPEPGTWAMFAGGCALLLSRLRRKRT